MINQEAKDLLLKDICARLPYGVKVHTNVPYFDLDTGELIECEESDQILDIADIDLLLNDCGEFKPYLRPMSNMTEDEDCVYQQMLKDIHYKPRPSTSLKLIDWLNAHYFDYNYLIDKGLALEAPADMYPHDEELY